MISGNIAVRFSYEVNITKQNEPQIRLHTPPHPARREVHHPPDHAGRRLPPVRERGVLLHPKEAQAAVAAGEDRTKKVEKKLRGKPAGRQAGIQGEVKARVYSVLALIDIGSTAQHRTILAWRVVDG